MDYEITSHITREKMVDLISSNMEQIGFVLAGVLSNVSPEELGSWITSEDLPEDADLSRILESLNLIASIFEGDKDCRSIIS